MEQNLLAPTRNGQDASGIAGIRPGNISEISQINLSLRRQSRDRSGRLRQGMVKLDRAA